MNDIKPKTCLTIRVVRPLIVIVLALALLPSTPRAQARSFKVATWNIRSGMGVRGFATTSWDDTTLNCTDPSKPMNAWGIGLPQKELQKIKADTSIVALAVQEAWNCGSPTNVNGVLGFKTATREEEGVGLIARYGFSGAPSYQRIDEKHNRWVIGGQVCLDAACYATLPIYSTHFGGSTDDDFPRQAERLLQALAAQATPHLFMGDLNLLKIDQWNPKTACTAKDSIGRVNAIATIERGGYADVWKVVERGEGWTGMASRKGCGSPSGSLYKRIDYVFTKGVPARSAARFARVPPGADSPSDHAGLVAELAWPARGR